MPSNIIVPELGESIVDARVARWLKQPGDPVAAGDPLVELETDKIDVEVGAPQAGVLGPIARGEGDDVKIGDVLGVAAAATHRRRADVAGVDEAHVGGIERVELVRALARKAGRSVGVLVDLQGPKIRIEGFRQHRVSLVDGARFVLDAALPADEGTSERVGISYKDMAADLRLMREKAQKALGAK